MKNKKCEYTSPELEKCKEILDDINNYIADMFKNWRKH